MADSILSEPAHTRFNISGPPLPFNGAAAAALSVALDSGDSGEGSIPGILFGILVPHIVCTLVILARGWSRIFLLKKWFLDDTLIILAWAFSTTVCIVYSIAAQSPQIQNHFNALTLSSLPADEVPFNTPAALRTYLGLIFYQLCLCLTKLSVLAFYLRIFSSRPLERRLAWATIIAVLLYGIPLLFMSVFQCHPVAGQFFGSPMKCFVFGPLLIASASLHTATDAWLIVLIIPCIVRLDLPPRQKAALALVLSLSIFVIAASLTRLQLSLRAASATGSATGPGSGSGKHADGDDDDDGDGVRVANMLAFFVMTVLELDMALICASAPTLRLVLARLWPRLGMGDPLSPEGGGRRRGRADTDDNDGSVDLTSVVSYHGYPWTEPTTPASRSKNPSMNNLSSGVGGANGYHQQGDQMPPVPPLALLAHRTPTTLSLRSFMSSMAPRSRGQTLTGGVDKEGDREGLLLGGDGGENARRSSVGFEGYYDQYLPGYGSSGNVDEKRRSRTLGLGMGSRRSSRRYSGRYSGRWGDSQESFVLGMNDPNSPTRLSPVISDSGLSRASTQVGGLAMATTIESRSSGGGGGVAAPRIE